MLHSPPPPLNGGRGGGDVLDLPRRRPRTTGRTLTSTARATGDPDRARLHRVVVVVAANASLLMKIPAISAESSASVPANSPGWALATTAAAWTAALHDCEWHSSPAASLDSSPSQLRLEQQREMFWHAGMPDQPQIGAGHQRKSAH
jgi:hypothetical protein